MARVRSDLASQTATATDGVWNGTTGNWSNPAVWVGGTIADGQDAALRRSGSGGTHQ